MNAETRERIQDLIRRADDGELSFHSLTTELQDVIDASPEPARAEPVALATDDDVEALAKQCGWNNRTYMKPAHYAEWCQKMRQFAALARPPALPPGWVAVPVEPTREMIEAADEADAEYTFRNFGDGASLQQQSGYDHYVAMLAAAPTCPNIIAANGENDD